MLVMLTWPRIERTAQLGSSLRQLGCRRCGHAGRAGEVAGATKGRAAHEAARCAVIVQPRIVALCRLAHSRRKPAASSA